MHRSFGAVAGRVRMIPGGARAGDKKAGSVRILYDTTWSTRGVLQAVGRKPRGKNPFDFQVCRLSYVRTTES